ncbi:MAG TPA: OmpA family protein [Bacteroidales bacterium]|nr:OmpA family protein [Bacteroidales bacterium]
MRIFITGFVVFVIWCFISAWLYTDKVLPAMGKPVPVQSIYELQTNVADSLAQLNESIPPSLMIYFEFDKVKFKTDPQTDIRISELKNWLEKYPLSNLLITGHTDLVGTTDYNHSLGLNRAKIIKNYLVEKGIPLANINTDSKGESQPLGDYLTEEGRAMNRRTEISIKMK